MPCAKAWSACTRHNGQPPFWDNYFRLFEVLWGKGHGSKSLKDCFTNYQLQIWEIRIRDSEFGVRDSGRINRGSGFGIRVGSTGVRDSGFGIRGSGFGIRVGSTGVRGSGLYGMDNWFFYFKSIYDTLYSHFVYCKIKS